MKNEKLEKKLKKSSKSKNKNKKQQNQKIENKSRSISKPKKDKKIKKLSKTLDKVKKFKLKSREKSAKKSKSTLKIKKNKTTQSKEKENEDEEDSKEDLTEEKNNNNLDLYALLGLTRTATFSEIRKAYKRLVLQCHPDKNKTDPETSSKFINISKAYKILSNEDSRRYYDETGEYDEENGGPIDIYDTYNFFKRIYSTKQIDLYQIKYKFSDEEEQDLIQYYNEYNGNMKYILEYIPFAENEDIPRFVEIFEKLIKKKILKKTKMFEETRDKIKKFKRNKKEEKEAEEALNKLKNGIMLKRQKRNFNDYLDGLAKRFGGGDEGGGDRDFNEIDEEEFLKISNRLKKGKKK